MDELDELWFITFICLFLSTSNQDRWLDRNRITYFLICFHLFSHFLSRLQVNLCQKHLFLHQLTQNITKNCSWNYHEQSVVIWWVNWCKNKSFWQRFTCTNLALELDGTWTFLGFNFDVVIEWPLGKVFHEVQFLHKILCLSKDMMDFQSSPYEQWGMFCPFLLEVLGLAWEPVRTRPLLWEAVLKYTVRPRRGNLETL